MNTSKIGFFGVEEIDVSRIKTMFPEAQVSSDPLTNENVSAYSDIEIACVFVHSRVTREVLDRLPDLQMIVTRSVGYDHIDLEVCKERNIRVCHVPDYGSHVIAEHVFALLLSTVRCVREADRNVEHCEFGLHGIARGIALKGKTLGIVGTGKIGKHVAKIAGCGFGMHVLAYDVHPDLNLVRTCNVEYASTLEDIWERADIISLHVPMFPSTKHMINKETLSQMKEGVIIVNTARGGLIDTKAFVEAVKSGKVAYAALDVLEHEENIAEDMELIEIPQVITTPHIAFYADDAVESLYDQAFEEINAFLSDKDPLHPVEGI